MHLHGRTAQAAQRHHVVFMHVAEDDEIDLVQVGPDVARHLGRVEGDARVGALHQHLVAIGVLAGFVALVHPHGAEVQTLHALSLRADDGTLPPPALSPRRELRFL